MDTCLSYNWQEAAHRSEDLPVITTATGATELRLVHKKLLHCYVGLGEHEHNWHTNLLADPGLYASVWRESEHQNNLVELHREGVIVDRVLLLDGPDINPLMRTEIGHTHLCVQADTQEYTQVHNRRMLAGLSLLITSANVAHLTCQRNCSWLWIWPVDWHRPCSVLSAYPCDNLPS